MNTPRIFAFIVLMLIIIFVPMLAALLVAHLTQVNPSLGQVAMYQNVLCYGIIIYFLVVKRRRY